MLKGYPWFCLYQRQVKFSVYHLHGQDQVNAVVTVQEAELSLLRLKEKKRNKQQAALWSRNPDIYCTSLNITQSCPSKHSLSCLKRQQMENKPSFKCPKPAALRNGCSLLYTFLPFHTQDLELLPLWPKRADQSPLKNFKPYYFQYLILGKQYTSNAHLNLCELCLKWEMSTGTGLLLLLVEILQFSSKVITFPFSLFL